MLDTIQKVLDLEEISTYHCEAVVAFYSPKNRLPAQFESPTRITDGCGKFLGFAALFQSTSGDLLAEMFLTRDSPERLDLESHQKRYYLVAHATRTHHGGVVEILELALMPHAVGLQEPFEPVSRVRPLKSYERESDE